MFLGMSSWGEGRRRSDGNCSVLIRVAGRVGGQFLQQVHTLFRGWWPLASVYPVQHGSRKGARFVSFQKIGSLPGKVNFLLTEAKGLFICLVFLSRCPNSPTKCLLNFTPPLRLSDILVSILLGSRRKELVLPVPISGPVLRSWLSWACFATVAAYMFADFTQSPAGSISWDVSIKPRLFPPSLLPASNEM